MEKSVIMMLTYLKKKLPNQECQLYLRKMETAPEEWMSHHSSWSWGSPTSLHLPPRHGPTGRPRIDFVPSLLTKQHCYFIDQVPPHPHPFLLQNTSPGPPQLQLLAQLCVLLSPFTILRAKHSQKFWSLLSSLQFIKYLLLCPLAKDHLELFPRHQVNFQLCNLERKSRIKVGGLMKISIKGMSPHTCSETQHSVKIFSLVFPFPV